MDADMLCLCDVYELIENSDLGMASLAVVKNPQLRFEWPSLMLFNNSWCKTLTPEYIDDHVLDDAGKPVYKNQPQSFEWARVVGALPSEYNHCIGYDKPRKDAKIVHFTQGIPCFEETKDCEYADEWAAEARMCMGTVAWRDIMGNSVHAKPVLERMAKKRQEMFEAGE